MASERILCVDDDANILQAFKRQLRGRFDIETALGPKAGLDTIREGGPFAVIMSDLRMPDMDGIEFLTQVREWSPDSVRVMLTGWADLNSAMSAVNDGNVFRFLTKPCPSEQLTVALEASLEQYRLVTAERELLEQTLTGSVQVLMEILSLVNPTAFGQASRLKSYVLHMAKRLELTNLWQFELAAVLSQIGCVTLPPDTLDKVYAGRKLNEDESNLFASHPHVAGALLSKIPRLEPVASMIEGQHHTYVGEHHDIDRLKLYDRTSLGSQMIRVALVFDRLIVGGATPGQAAALLRDRKSDFPTGLLDTLESFGGDSPLVTRNVWVKDLTTVMTLDEDVRSRNGLLLVARGQRITYPLLERLRALSHTVGVVEPFRVLAPRDTDEAGAGTEVEDVRQAV